MMTSLKFIFPCKKLRRSHRLELREKTDTFSKTINDGPLGYFDIIPLELKFVVFTYLQVEELSMLTITSKAIRNIVELYKNTNWAPQFLQAKSVDHGPYTSEKPAAFFYTEFERLGLLMKRSTCLYTTKDRLKLMHQFSHKYLCSFSNCNEPLQCIALNCYGIFLHTVIAGWDDKECTRTFQFVTESTMILKSLSSVIKAKPGSLIGQELNIRLFLRRILIDQCASKLDKAFWLNLILRTYPMVQQARIIFLLFGPMHGEDIQWYEMCESTPVNKDHAKMWFGDLSMAFRLLHFYSKDWSEDAVISVLDEMTCFPDEWLAENTANLLFLCGDAITLKVLSSKAINGRLTELANIITSLCLVCWRHSQPVTWTIEMIHSLCSVFEHPRERVSFLHMIVDTFREVLLDLHEYGDSVNLFHGPFEDEASADFQNMLEAQADFCRELIVLAFQNIIKT